MSKDSQVHITSWSCDGTSEESANTLRTGPRSWNCWSVRYGVFPNLALHTEVSTSYVSYVMSMRLPTLMAANERFADLLSIAFAMFSLHSQISQCNYWPDTGFTMFYRQQIHHDSRELSHVGQHERPTARCWPSPHTIPPRTELVNSYGDMNIMNAKAG